KGSLISMDEGTTTAHALNKLQDRGTFFVEPNEKVYTGQILGENTRHDDLAVKATKGKKLSNVRSAGADEKVILPPARKFSLEETMEYIAEDEYVEVTPSSVRMRKILLTEIERKRGNNNVKA
ncbi:MAG: translational GTPase TypA, partial [Flavobacteriales bacterium]